MKTVKITKMQGCGNDFVIIDYSEFEKVGISMSDFAIKICDRNFGVGADGLIITNPKQPEDADVAWFFYNSDGSTAQMCGNGMRCFAKYLFDNKIVDKKIFSVKTGAGTIIP
ncbi:MAG: diaminopimelate epimerase, partial [Oscillospiraceae bacterium]